MQALILRCEPARQPWQTGAQRCHPAAVCSTNQANQELQLEQDLPRTLRESLFVPHSPEPPAVPPPLAMHGGEQLCNTARRLLLGYTRGGVGGYLQGMNEVAGVCEQL